MKLAFIGMTHLGLVSSIAAAVKGHEIVCFDRNVALIEKLTDGEIPFIEPNVKEQLLAHRENIHFTSKLSDLQDMLLVYVAPDIPTNTLGESDLSAIQTLIDHITPHLHQEANLVILSQVSPGYCRTVNWNKSQLFYQVETLIFGQALHRALYPERFILGLDDPTKPLPTYFKDYLNSYECPILPMEYESAELSKIAINLFLVSSVTTTNTVAELCEKIGAKWGEIAGALKLDKRIGKDAYLSPGLGIAGGNLERDMVTFCKLADTHGSDCSLIRTFQNHSKRAADWTLKKLHAKGILQKADPKIALLGLAYKKDTSSIKNSPAVRLLEHLTTCTVNSYDPAVESSCLRAKDTCDGADALVVMTPWDEFKTATLPIDLMRNKVVIDPYGILADRFGKDPNIQYEKIGEK
ncbi:MAG: UDP-glucose 6-dehydrogenase TuaD [Chlamydiia bacterium]|nr:UDP-glucose 6-dehydrogenase TuaD [Chlamydiia bacterium]MCH9616417.1 UDP-glucose 6-dehydrogenase TuaD [Chlamydiia bacterium]MCH9629597.1 UDP-glucose 6-dehydrogenase TuaD [Chlamydiia bacterium]